VPDSVMLVHHLHERSRLERPQDDTDLAAPSRGRVPAEHEVYFAISDSTEFRVVPSAGTSAVRLRSSLMHPSDGR